jgi:hypothetical protein
VANAASVQHDPGGLVHRQLVPVRQVFELEQVGARVAAVLLVVAVTLHLHATQQHLLQVRDRDPAAALRGRRRRLDVAVEEPHGALGLAARGRRLAEAGARVRGRRRRARGLRRGRGRAAAAVVLAAGEDEIEEPREARAGGRRLAAQVAELGADGGARPRLLFRRRGRGRAADGGADGAQAAVLRRLGLGGGEVAVAGAVGGARRGGGGERPAAGAVAPRQRRLVVALAVVQRFFLTLLGGLRRAVAGLVHGLVYGVQQRRREGRLVGV